MSTKTNCTLSHSENPTATMQENFGHKTCTIQSQFVTYEREILLKFFFGKTTSFSKNSDNSGSSCKSFSIQCTYNLWINTAIAFGLELVQCLHQTLYSILWSDWQTHIHSQRVPSNTSQDPSWKQGMTLPLLNTRQ